MSRLRYIKYGVWLLGAAALLWLACVQGFGNGSAYIQFVDGALLVYGAGEFVHKRAHIKRFVESHRHLHTRLDELHAKHDELQQQLKEGQDDKRR